MDRFQRVLKSMMRAGYKSALYAATLSTLKIIPESTGTAATDGKNLWYNPLWIDTLPEEEIMGVIVHEAIHVLFQHPQRAKRLEMTEGKRRKIAQVAMDIVTNEFVVDREGYRIPSDGIYHPEFRDKSFEQVCALLAEQEEQEGGAQNSQGEQEQEQPAPDNNNQKPSDSESDSDQKEKPEASNGDQDEDDREDQSKSDDEEETGGDDNQDKEPGESTSSQEEQGDSQDQDEEPDDSSSSQEGQEDETSSDQEENDADGQLQQHQNNDWSNDVKPFPGDIEEGEAAGNRLALNMLKLAKTWGVGDLGYLEAKVKEIIAPPREWIDIAIEMLQKKGREDYEMLTPNKKFLPIYLPALGKGHECQTIVGAIDTSGSISEWLMARFMGGLRQVLEEIPNNNLILIQCDDQIREVKEGVISEELEDITINGYGNTNLSPPFKWVEENGVQPDILIYFTDLEAPTLWGVIEAPPYPVLWVVWETSGYSIEPHFGVVAKLN